MLSFWCWFRVIRLGISGQRAARPSEGEALNRLASFATRAYAAPPGLPSWGALPERHRCRPHGPSASDFGPSTWDFGLRAEGAVVEAVGVEPTSLKRPTATNYMLSRARLSATW